MTVQGRTEAMNLNEEIRLAGAEIEIVRDDGNLYTYMYYGHVGKMAGKYRSNPDDIHQAGYYLPTDSGVKSGDLIKSFDDYYIVASLVSVNMYGDIACYKGMLFRCNSEVSVYYYDSTAKKHDTLHKAGVRCLITQSRVGQGWQDDKSFVMDYKGRSQPFSLYAQALSGVNKECKIVDSYGRVFRTSKDMDVFIIDGVIQTQILWVNN